MPTTIWSRRQEAHGKAGSEERGAHSLSYRRYSSSTVLLQLPACQPKKLVAASRQVREPPYGQAQGRKLPRTV